MTQEEYRLTLAEPDATLVLLTYTVLYETHTRDSTKLRLSPPHHAQSQSALVLLLEITVA